MEFLTHFGLVRAPFSLEANPQDYYQSGVQSRVLLNLQTKLANGDNDIRVQGEAGLGKSILAQQLVAQLSPDTYAPVLVRDIVAGFPQHIRALLQAAWGGDSSEVIGDLVAKGIQPVLVIDGAEKLTADSAELVSQLQESGLSVVRFGRSEKEAELVLSTWDSKAIARMIVHRLKSAGSQRSLFARDALLKLVKKSEGNPGQAVLLCSEALYAAWLAASDTVHDELTDAIAGSDFSIAQLHTAAAAGPEKIGEISDDIDSETEVENPAEDVEEEFELDSEPEAELEEETTQDEISDIDEGFDLEDLTGDEEGDGDTGFEIEALEDDGTAGSVGEDSGFSFEDLDDEPVEDLAEDLSLAESESEGFSLDEDDGEGFGLEALDSDQEEDSGFELEDLGEVEEEPEVSSASDDLDSMLDDLSISDVEAAAQSDSDLGLGGLDDEGADEEDDPLSDLDDLLMDDGSSETEEEDDGLDELSEFESLAGDIGDESVADSAGDEDLAELDSELDSIMENVTESAEDDLDDLLSDFGDDTEIVDTAEEEPAPTAASGDPGDEDLESELDDLLKEFEDF